ncbi:hypothetical protein V6N13_051053 [Hibiscus sabdariffa]
MTKANIKQVCQTVRSLLPVVLVVMRKEEQGRGVKVLWTFQRWEGNWDVDTRLMKVQLSVADGEGKFREVVSHLKEFDRRVDNLREEFWEP